MDGYCFFSISLVESVLSNVKKSCHTHTVGQTVRSLICYSTILLLCRHYFRCKQYNDHSTKETKHLGHFFYLEKKRILQAVRCCRFNAVSVLLAVLALVPVQLSVMLPLVAVQLRVMLSLVPVQLRVMLSLVAVQLSVMLSLAALLLIVISPSAVNSIVIGCSADNPVVPGTSATWSGCHWSQYCSS